MKLRETWYNYQVCMRGAQAAILSARVSFAQADDEAHLVPGGSDLCGSALHEQKSGSGQLSPGNFQFSKLFSPPLSVAHSYILEHTRPTRGLLEPSMTFT